MVRSLLSLIGASLGSGVLTALEEEPGSLLGLVDPVLQQARGCHISGLVAERMNLAHVPRQYCVIVAEFGDHAERLNVFSIVVHDALKARDLPDRTNRCPADLARALGNGILMEKSWSPWSSSIK
jgi:hypothetical protein